MIHSCFTCSNSNHNFIVV